jgi:hypothetical protein
MKFRTMLLTAAIVLPLAFDSTPVMAQQRGQDRAAVASVNGVEHRQQEAPRGLMRRFAAGVIDALPDGIIRRFGNPAPEPAPEPTPEPTPEPEPEPEPEPCVTVPDEVDGVWGYWDCDGIFHPLF